MSRIFYELSEGSGGIFTLPITHNLVDEPSTHAIGTLGLDTCVGFYIPLSSTQCFAAHIYASIDDDDGTDERISGVERDRIPIDNQGKLLENKVVQLLTRIVGPHMPSDEEELRRRADEAIVVCNRSRVVDDKGEEYEAVGPSIIRGLRRFFDVEFQVTVGRGFAVDIGSGAGDVFMSESEGTCDWRPCNTEKGRQEKSWKLVFRNGVWWEREAMDDYDPQEG